MEEDKCMFCGYTSTEAGILVIIDYDKDTPNSGKEHICASCIGKAAKIVLSNQH